MQNTFEAYLKDLKNTPLKDQTEHTSRAALEKLLQHFAEQADRPVKVQHEPRKVADKGAPDFRITSRGMILGYVEVKQIGAALDKLLKSDQIARYRSLSGNILLTDYLDFIWLDEKTVRGRAHLAYPHDLDQRNLHLKAENTKAVAQLLAGFFSIPPTGIGDVDELAKALATRSTLLRDFLSDELNRQEKSHQEGRLWGLYQIFKSQIFHELTVKDFADAFTQMLVYGLFLARLNSGTQAISLHSARGFVPGSFQLIRELVDFLGELDKPEYRDIRWVVEEVLSIVNGLNLAAIQEGLSFRQRKATSRKLRAQDEEEHRLFERDPFIYFYEDYLKAYDKEMRKARGVYYTPPPIVNFIVRAVDDVLRDKFDIPQGLADHKRVTVLDFACGTGTFLLEVMNQIFDNIGGPDSGKAALVVREHILKNLYGFEYLIAPYTIAHLKLSQYLKDKGHPLAGDERLQVFLTNTLEPIEPQKNFLLPAITQEVENAQAVKDKPILVIVGNPPYSGHSKNNGPWIKAKIDDYRMVDGQPLGERNPKWLQDDYVKFIRFAQEKMGQVAEGVVGIITNHSWLDNPTFRGMRRSLMNSFEQIYVLDLHGNTKKKEKAPDGSKDENVFDIEQGVAISLFIKRKGLERGIWRGDLWGKRLEKYLSATTGGTEELISTKLAPTAPEYLFLEQNKERKTEYELGWSLKDIFPVNSVGIVTARDHLAIHFEKDELMEVVRDFSSLPTEKAREKYVLGKDVRDWHVEWAQKDIIDHACSPNFARQALYRPFDIRWTFYSGKSRGFLCYPRNTVMKNFIKDNLGLISTRTTKVENFKHVYITDKPNDVVCISPMTSNNGFNFPLFVNNLENIHKSFRNFIDKLYNNHPLPEEIIGFIYAILHAPTYRQRYAEFLRMDFPRIPFPEHKADFDALSSSAGI